MFFEAGFGDRVAGGEVGEGEDEGVEADVGGFGRGCGHRGWGKDVGGS